MFTAPPFPDDPTAATRHLCAGAYLDEAFRDVALGEVYHRPGRAVALSFGFTLTPVLAHCLRSRGASLVRDGAVTAILVGSLFVAPVALLYAVVLAAVVHAAVTRSSWALLLAASAGAAAALVTAPGATLVGALAAAGRPRSPGVCALLILAGLLICAGTWTLWRQAQLERFRPGRTPAAPVQNQRLRDIDLLQYGNTVVHAGYQPFIGAGRVVDRWNVAQPLGEDSASSAFGASSSDGSTFDASSFDAAEMVAHLQWHLGALVGGPGTVPEETIAGMTVTDRVHLAGTEVGHLDPITTPGLVADIIRRPTAPARHHLACQVPSWGGEVVTTVHIHTAVQGGALYLEITTTALTPCPERYRIVDLPDGAGPHAWVRAVRDAVTGFPAIAARAPLNLLRAVAETFFPDRQAFTRPDRPGADPDRKLRVGLDHGARVSVREISAPPADPARFPDIAKHQRLIERRVLDSVIAFLDARGLDSSVCRAGATARLTPA